MSSRDLMVIGSSNVDHVVKVAAFPKPGQTVHGSGFEVHFGGKGANQAVAAALTATNNTHVRFLSCVGSDSYADQIVERMQAAGVDTTHVRRCENITTGIATIVVQESDGENTIVLTAGANALLSTGDVEAAQTEVEGAAVLLAQLETSVDTTVRAFESNPNALRVLNPAPLTEPLAKELLACVDVLVPNETELEVLCDGQVDRDNLVQSSMDLAQAFVEQHKDLVLVVTLGAHGALYVDAERSLHLESHAVHSVVDTTGAGDAFTGSMCAVLADCVEDGRASMEDWAKAIDVGQFHASISVTRAGAQSSYGDWDKTS